MSTCSKVKLIVAAVAAVAALVVAQAASASGVASAASEPVVSVHGIVMHQNGASHSYVIAADGGRLFAVHVACRPPLYRTCGPMPRMGQPVDAKLRQLANDTWTALSETGYSGTYLMARVAGAVTYAKPRARLYVLSAPGVSVLVHAASRHPMPRAGDAVSVDVTWASDQTWYAADLYERGFSPSAPVEARVIAGPNRRGRVALAAYDDQGWDGFKEWVIPPAGMPSGCFTPGRQLAVRISTATDQPRRLLSAFRDANAHAAGQACPVLVSDTRR